MSLRRAPSALRRPISAIRSVTDTSMMFITPMPPTSSEMPATPASSRVSAVLVASRVLRIDAWVVMVKSAWAGSVIRWVCSSRSSTSSVALSMASRLSALTRMRCTLVSEPPVMSSPWAVEMGTTARSSGLKRPWAPRGWRIPITRKGTCWMSTSEPMALPPGKRFAAVVGPSTATWAWSRTSSLVTNEPLST